MAWGLHRSSAARPQAVGAALRAWLAAAVAPGPLAAEQGRHAQALVALAGRTEEALSVDVALPFCASHCLCCERQVHVAQPAAVLDAYVADLVEEMAGLARVLGPGREVLRLHLGGGTANELSEAQLSQVVDGIERHCRLPAEALLSADCDPRRIGWVQLHALRGLGFRELTFGVLDLDAAVQAAIGRSHTPQLLGDVCDMARESGIGCIELRLMVGLPRQSAEGWRRTLRQVLALAPDRISIGRYHHQPALVAGQRDIDEGELPDAAQTRALVCVTAEVLGEAGYRWLGADHFVLESDELAQAAEAGRLRFGLGGYSALPPLPQLGLGVGAVSDIDGRLFWNEAALALWHERVRAGESPVVHAAVPDAAALKRRAAVEQLLCKLHCALPADMADAARWAPLVAEGAVELGEQTLKVTETGRAVLAEVCARFAADARPLKGSSASRR